MTGMLNIYLLGLEANLWPDWRWWEAAPASSTSASGALREKQSVWSPSGTGCRGVKQSPGLHLKHKNKVKQSQELTEQTVLNLGLCWPRATEAMVNRTNRFLLRQALRLLLLMEPSLSFMMLALLSMARCRRLLRSPLSGSWGLSAFSFRKRLALLGGFSFIIISSTWSRREVSWETVKTLKMIFLWQVLINNSV